MLTDKTDAGQVLATITPSPGRRFLGIGLLWLLAALVICIAILRPPEMGWQVFLFVLGGVSIWIAEQMRRATADTLELTRDELRDTSGTLRIATDDIVAIDRGMFAFKPSNGFLLRLSTSNGRGWRPGLWWRTGSRVGIGGMTPAHQAKFMAELISALIDRRDGAS